MCGSNCHSSTLDCQLAVIMKHPDLQKCWKAVERKKYLCMYVQHIAKCHSGNDVIEINKGQWQLRGREAHTLPGKLQQGS